MAMTSKHRRWTSNVQCERLRFWVFTTALVVLITPADTRGQAAADSPPEEAIELIERFGLRESPVASRDLPGWAPTRRVMAFTAAERVAILAADHPELEFVSAGSFRSMSEAERNAILADADVLLGFCGIASRMPQVRWIQMPSAGVAPCLEMGLEDRHVTVTNAQRLYGPQIAEHALAMILAFSRRLPELFAFQQRGEWGQDGLRLGGTGSWELTGKTLFVVGLGGIGTELARRAHALGMRVVATRNSSREGPDFVDYVGLSDELHALAGEADVIVSAVPLTPATTGMYDAAFFEAMNPEGYFINVGRGESVVTDDLVEALRVGQLAGAGLDVFDPEPLPAGHPLWAMPNVIITPHSASTSDVASGRQFILQRENLRRWVAGEPLLSVVDLRRGY